QPYIDQGLRLDRGDDVLAHAEELGVVILYRTTHCYEIVSGRGSNAVHFTGGDGRSDAGPADEYAAVRVPIEDGLCRLEGNLRIRDVCCREIYNSADSVVGFELRLQFILQ